MSPPASAASISVRSSEITSSTHLVSSRRRRRLRRCEALQSWGGHSRRLTEVHHVYCMPLIEGVRSASTSGTMSRPPTGRVVALADELGPGANRHDGLSAWSPVPDGTSARPSSTPRLAACWRAARFARCARAVLLDLREQLVEVGARGGFTVRRQVVAHRAKQFAPTPAAARRSAGAPHRHLPRAQHVAHPQMGGRAKPVRPQTWAEERRRGMDAKLRCSRAARRTSRATAVDTVPAAAQWCMPGGAERHCPRQTRRCAARRQGYESAVP